MRRSTVRDVMTEPAIAVSERTPFKAIVETLTRHGVSAVPVTGASGRIVGVVSEADLIVKEEVPAPSPQALHPLRNRWERRRSDGMVAADLMTSPAVTIRPEATVAEAARIMTVRHLKQLPVVDGDGRLRGVVSRRDLLGVFLRSDREIRDEIVHGLIEQTLWIDPSRIPVAVQDGVVTLGGRVEHRSMLPLLAELVRAVEGVVDLQLQTTFEVDDTQEWGRGPYPWHMFPLGA